MPHTSHKKKHARIKRQEIVGDDGWTRVMSNKPLSVTGALPSLDHQQPVEEAPEGLTESDVLARYIDIEKRWKASESWKTMEDTLKTRVIASDTRIDACALYGSGTFTGLAQGWINRTHVAMYQLAAFKAVVDLIHNCTGQRPLAYAQEPLYNTQDVALLSTLDIQKVDDPSGFHVLTNRSFAFCPGAELHVILQTLVTDPLIYLAGELDTYLGALGYLQSRTIACGDHIMSSKDTTRDREPRLLLLDEIEELGEEIIDSSGARLDKTWLREKRAQQEPNVNTIERVLRSKEVARIPDLDVQDHPLYNTCLYWPRHAD